MDKRNEEYKEYNDKEVSVLLDTRIAGIISGNKEVYTHKNLGLCGKLTKETERTITLEGNIKYFFLERQEDDITRYPELRPLPNKLILRKRQIVLFSGD